MEKYIIILIIILTAVWNGLVIKWGLEPDKKKVTKISVLWHAVGFVIRLLCAVAVYLYAGWIWFWIAVILSWHVYDIIINLIRGLKWYHTGQNFFDRAPWCWIAKGIVLLAGLLFII